MITVKIYIKKLKSNQWNEQSTSQKLMKTTEKVHAWPKCYTFEYLIKTNKGCIHLGISHGAATI